MLPTSNRSWNARAAYTRWQTRNRRVAVVVWAMYG
jgi:hypothetical protein